MLSSGFYDAYYKKASLVRELIRTDFREAFQQVDVIFAPTAPNVAWKIGEKGDDPLALYMEDVFTVPASLAGLPGLSVPAGYALPSDGGAIPLPVGLQILGPVQGESRVLEVGNVMERALREVVSAHRPQIG